MLINFKKWSSWWEWTWKKFSTKTKNILKDEKSCVICGSEIKIEKDHIIPKSKWWNNNKDNMQTLCRECNRQKYNKTMDEYIERLKINDPLKYNRFINRFR